MQVEHAQLAVHLGVLGTTRMASPSVRGGRTRGERLGVDRGELARRLTFAHDPGDGGPPAPVQGLAVPGVGIARGAWPTESSHSTHSSKSSSASPTEHEQRHQLHQPVAGAGHLGHRVGGLGVEVLVGERQRLGRDVLLAGEVVDDQGRLVPAWSATSLMLVSQRPSSAITCTAALRIWRRRASESLRRGLMPAPRMSASRCSMAVRACRSAPTS